MSSNCPDCQIYRARIQELEAELDKFKRPKDHDGLRATADHVYDYYKINLRAGGRIDAINSIAKLLKGGATVHLLISAIDRAKAAYRAEGRSPRYYPQANNFFGQAAYWEDFRDEPEPPEDPDDYVTDFAGNKIKI